MGNIVKLIDLLASWSLTLHPTGALNTSEHVLSLCLLGARLSIRTFAPPQAERMTEGIPPVALGWLQGLAPSEKNLGSQQGVGARPPQTGEMGRGE